MSLPALFLTALIGSLSLARGFSEDGLIGFRNWIYLYGVFWLAAVWKQWRWFPPFALLVSVIFAILGVTNGAPLHWMTAGAAGALLFWDISNFRLQVALLPKREDIHGLERRRYFRLTIIMFVVLCIATVPAFIQGNASRPWYVLLAFIFALTAAQFLVWLFRKR